MWNTKLWFWYYAIVNYRNIIGILCDSKNASAFPLRSLCTEMNGDIDNSVNFLAQNSNFMKISTNCGCLISSHGSSFQMDINIQNISDMRHNSSSNWNNCPRGLYIKSHNFATCIVSDFHQILHLKQGHSLKLGYRNELSEALNMSIKIKVFSGKISIQCGVQETESSKNSYCPCQGDTQVGDDSDAKKYAFLGCYMFVTSLIIVLIPFYYKRKYGRKHKLNLAKSVLEGAVNEAFVQNEPDLNDHIHISYPKTRSSELVHEIQTIVERIDHLVTPIKSPCPIDNAPDVCQFVVSEEFNSIIDHDYYEITSENMNFQRNNYDDINSESYKNNLIFTSNNNMWSSRYWTSESNSASFDCYDSIYDDSHHNINTIVPSYV